MGGIDLGRLYSVAGKTVLVTGGVGGIGRMLSTAFVAAGAKVYLTGRKPDALAEAVAALGADGEAVGIHADLATPEGVAIVSKATEPTTRMLMLLRESGANHRSLVVGR